MEIRDSTYATILGLRGKRAKGKKLEKYEQEFYRENRDLIVLKAVDSDSKMEEEYLENTRIYSDCFASYHPKIFEKKDIF